MPAVGVILFLDRKKCFQGFVMYRDRTLEKTDVRLYAVTDRSWLNGRTLYEQVEEALQGGATMVQLREKQLSRQQFLEEARRIKKLCAAYHAPFIINDDAELCREVDADGVHVGQTDMAVPDVRAEIGAGRLIGVSARTVEQAVMAWKQGADYLGAGAVFPTGTKRDASPLSYKTLQEICAAVPIPVVAIGGITAENISTLRGSGISGVAVVSAIFAQPDIRGAARGLLAQARRITDGMDTVSDFLKRERPAGMIFDVDGTLLDSMPVWAHSGERYLAGLGIAAPPSLGKTLFSMTLPEGAAYIRRTYQLEQTADEIRKGVVGVVADAYRTTIGLKPAVPAFLQALREKQIPMSVVTAGERALVEAAFGRLGIAQYFDAVITCIEFGSGKDRPDIFYAAAEKMGVPPERTWVAEDGLYAVKTAKRAGFRTIGVSDAVSADDAEEMRMTADYYIALA